MWFERCRQKHIGKALAEKLNYQFIDIEDIYFPKDNPEYMYLNPRPFEEVERILSNIISENNNFVLASVKGNFNKDIVSHFKYAVYIEAPKETRIKRVYERSYNKFGDRMLEGGDLYEKETKRKAISDKNTLNYKYIDDVKEIEDNQ